MHDKLAHPTVDQLMRRITQALLPETAPQVRKLAEKVTKCCKICEKFRKPHARPKTSGMSARN
eukprot:8480821-Pyramimonas_sp.AAC.1